jgi:cell division GTPase FtsZ
MYAARLRSQVDLERQSVGMLGTNSAIKITKIRRHEMDDLKYELQEETRKGARIKVIGVGGGGSNASAACMKKGSTASSST